MCTGLKLGRPNIWEWAVAEFTKGSVHITTVGIPLFSRDMASCILHEVQDPQSAIAVTTKSHRSDNRSTISAEAGLE